MPSSIPASSSRRPCLVVIAAAAVAASVLAVSPTVAAQEQPADRPVCSDAVPPASWMVDRAQVPQVHQAAMDCAAFLTIVRGVPTSTGHTELRPGQPVSRAAMASLLARLLLVAGVELPPPSQETFDDVKGSVHADAIHRLHAAGIVNGRTSSTYVPDEPVSRDQTAALLLRAAAFARGVDAGSLERDDSPFTDIASSVHRRAIAGAHALGFVRGVTASRYAPGLSTTRAQMASLLVRTLELEVQPVQTCTNSQDEYTVYPPASWHTNDPTTTTPCTAFDPQPFQLEPGTHDIRQVAIVVKDEPVLYEDAIGSDNESVVARDQQLLLGTRRATVQERVARNDGFRPDGERYTIWFVDRGDHTLVGETNDAGDKDYDTNQGVLARMLLSLALPDPEPMAFQSVQTVDTAPAGDGSIGLVDVSTGRHEGYDRVVLELGGDGTVGWRVAYTDDPREQGSGNPVTVEGEATLQIHLEHAGYPGQDGTPRYDGPDRVDGPGTSVHEVLVGTVFEGIRGVFAGTPQPLPFRVFRLDAPQRVVIDVAHPPAG